MGSLMAGWDSPVKDPNSVKLTRNKSLTREEIDAFWRLKKKTEEEHLRHLSSLVDVNKEDLPTEEQVEKLVEEAANLEDLIKRNGWWTKSTWAFLNEPPLPEGRPNSYTPQFHVANIAKVQDNAGISA